MNVLFVCLGNICRSPLAEALLKKKYQEAGIEAEVDSAGFEPYLINKEPDEKTVTAGEKHGIKVAGSSRLFVKADFDRFDKIYAMDTKNYLDIIELGRSKSDIDKVDLIMNTIQPGKNIILKDPFQSGDDDCEIVIGILDKVSDAIVKEAKEFK